MPQTLTKSNSFLGIRIEEAPGTSFEPGDTIIGRVYRKTRAVSPRASVTISLHGGSEFKIVVRNGQSSTFRRHDFFNARDTTYTIFDGPLHIEPASSGVAWPFAITIPSSFDHLSLDRGVPEDHSHPSLGPDDVAARPLPSTFSTGNPVFPQNPRAFVEYFLQAELRLYNHRSTDVYEATLPLSMVNSPEPPITNYHLRLAKFQRGVNSQRLVPGMEDAELTFTQRTQKFFGSPKIPNFIFQAQVEIPTVMQLNDPHPIPICLRVNPLWAKTSDIIRGVPQKVKLTSLALVLKADTEVKWSDIFNTQHASTLHKPDLTVDAAFHALGHDLYVPCSVEDPPLDVGQLVNFRIGPHGRISPAPDYSGQPRVYPCFTTNNIRHSHRLQWEVRLLVAGETVEVMGEGQVTVLSPSDSSGRSAWMRPPTAPENTDSWIRPPAEEEKEEDVAPPSFTEAQNGG
ncbi:hypothetical protein QBC33DRAFT_574546 [Phialemonium atrogriseum]|uniref:Arrestin-like N-terminal domain-containing protein n=1 Tax=Phialemonium atrogriseum TaxID=1093897 RepID=A0AAJ0BQ54_9PEZI|nr:uncharacterized protein QBC33DRAFT_574546 [Phialemonium atrogriseum]KAK1762032.1 hypothetical protein QBC33DRAFT_574546 [Phialemonium atrogriseum]